MLKVPRGAGVHRRHARHHGIDILDQRCVVHESELLTAGRVYDLGVSAATLDLNRPIESIERGGVAVDRDLPPFGIVGVSVGKIVHLYICPCHRT